MYVVGEVTLQDGIKRHHLTLIIIYALPKFIILHGTPVAELVEENPRCTGDTYSKEILSYRQRMPIQVIL